MRRLSEGAVVEASVRARLLGIPLLKLEAAIVLVPADVRGAALGRGAGARASVRSTLPPAGSNGTGLGLAEAVRNIDEAAQVLAHVRRNGR
jgi:hypothetical protein